MEKMRLVVLVDLPAKTRHENKVRREYCAWLFTCGFSLLQDNVYTRLANGRDSMEMHVARLRSHCPDFGTVRLFTMTERQFCESALLAGEEPAQEIEIGSQLDIFL